MHEDQVGTSERKSLRPSRGAVAVFVALALFVGYAVWQRVTTLDLDVELARIGGAVERSFPAPFGQRVIALLTPLPRPGWTMLGFFETSLDDAWLARNWRTLRREPDLEIFAPGTQVTDAGTRSLRRVPNISQLMLRETQITDSGLEALSALENLGFIAIAGTKVTPEGLQNLTRLRQLTHLEIDGRQASVTGLHHVANCKRMAILSIRGASDETVSNLAGWNSLQVLTLSGNGVTDLSVQTIKGLAGLQGLTLVNTSISESGLAELKAALPALSVDIVTEDELTQMWREAMTSKRASPPAK